METSFFRFFFVDYWPWWLGGIVIGLLVPALYYFLNTALGVSTGYGNFIKIFRPKTKLKWLNSKTFQNPFNRRFFFMMGMILGAFVSARLSGMPSLTLAMGKFTANISWSFPAIALWFFTGGVLMGFGARIAGGCTSGHSIHGIANLHLSSIIATIFFLMFGTIFVNLIRFYLLGGV